ncbi:MAG: ribosome biogenesis GTPase Der [Candidatus Cloacimonadota bacterium]|nr:MAG: ribosome biogenesis GTPase Der [Candidatus Cloacimonadota bacterium]
MRSIAIVGRPNVGKSTLFNRLVGVRQSITTDTAGTTRDRIYGDMEWENKYYEIIDTGGLELLNKDDHIQKQINMQAEIAVDEAEVIFFLVDGREGLMPLDEHVADFLRKTGKQVYLFVNKVDDYDLRDCIYDFYTLGFGEPIWFSSLHGVNMDKLFDKVQEYFSQHELPEELDDEGTKVAIVGQPNVGKSTLLNKFLKTDRVMVDSVAGTTRDPIKEPFELGGKKFTLIDTAGIRRVNKLKEHVDKIAVIYSDKVIERADLVLYVLDASRPLSTQDKRIAGKILEEQKPCIVVINKWDTVVDKEETVEKLETQYEEELYFLKFCPHVYISALTGTKVPKLQDAILDLSNALDIRTNTNHLNKLIQEAVLIHKPPMFKGKQLKIYYVSQLKSKSGIFIFQVNDSNLIHFSYYRYLENTIRDMYKFEGIPLKLIFKGKK